ncbi:MAG: WD40 repeat domain-containing protein, partial [Clostridia bacterium]|nr:WD40 repeat domain-containing protein [Clostridia bacterium]
LLKKNGLYDEIERLLSDITFADAMIKADKLTELCDFYAYLEEKGILGDYGKKLFSCIKNNSSTLDCYKNGLPGCAESNGIIKAGSILSDFPSGTKSMNFDAKEKIYLSHDGKRYAVIRDEYVYVYREDAYRYYLSIHIELEDYVMQERIINIIWTKDDKLVLVMEDEYLYVYDIREDVPKLEIRIDHISETENVKYVYDYNYLLVMRKNRLTAIDMTEYEIAYELKGPGTAFFDINENEDELLWLMKNSQARRYNLKSGEAIKAETLHYNFTGDADSVYLFDNGIGVGIYNSYNKEVRFLCGETKKYIYFPKSDEIQGFIKYKNALIALYENMIIKASMKDFSLAYVNVPGLCGAYYAGNGDALLAVTEKETKKIREQEFLPFSEKLYLSGKTVDASREMMIGFMLHTMKTYFACDTKRDSFRTLFRRDNSAFRYDASKNSNLYKEYLEKITFMAFYKDSYVMVANEGKGNIRIYDAEGKEIFCLKKLKFSVSNVILESEFSEDGKFLYILETDGIIVIDVKKRKVLSKFGFDKNP